MTIDRATREDLEAILQLQYLAYQSEAELFGTQDIPPLKQTLDEVVREYEEGIILRMTDEQNRIIGSVRAKEQDGTVYIGKLMVHPEYRRRGLGSALLTEIEKWYPGKRYELFTSTRSVDNIRLYRKMGYTPFRQEAVTDELVFVYLEKRKPIQCCESRANPKYYLCRRYFPELPIERNWFGELIREVIAVDGALFPKEEQTVLTEEQAMTIEIEDGDQVLRVLRVPGGKESSDIPAIAAQTVEGFKFCGYDLADSWVSAILNCGSFVEGDYYSKAFDYRELNEFGLIPDYQSAVRISRKLREEYPGEEHVYCDVFAIWRRINAI